MPEPDRYGCAAVDPDHPNHKGRIHQLSPPNEPFVGICDEHFAQVADDEGDVMDNSEHDELEDAYQRGRESGTRDERERAIRAGVFREGKYIEAPPSRGAVEASEGWTIYLDSLDGRTVVATMDGHAGRVIPDTIAVEVVRGKNWRLMDAIDNEIGEPPSA